MEREEFTRLAEKILNGKASDEELEKYVKWFNASQAYESEIPDADLKKATIYRGITNTIYRRKSNQVWFWRAAAAILIFIGVAGATYYLSGKKDNTTLNTALTKSDIKPGGNKATLTLSNGKEIVLDDTKPGQIAADQGIAIKKSKTGQVIYDLSKANLSRQVAYQTNTLNTPRGGQYQIVLPDGTLVWLNAASSLKFPSAFTGNTRDVELTGEAYFEVTKDKLHPFHVKSGDQQIEVLGTHFEVNSYTDEHIIKTTLLEGSVKIISGKANTILKPGQQSMIPTGENNPQIIVKNENDTDEILAWKNGLFIYNNTDIPALMRQISRWYDVDIVYEGKIPDDKFSGTISRSVNLSKVLKLLQYTGINFKIEGRKIIIK